MTQKTIIFLAIIGSLLGLFTVQFVRYQRLEDQVAGLRQASETQQQQMRADEAMLSGDSATAFPLYAAISDSLLQARRETFQNLFSSRTNTLVRVIREKASHTPPSTQEEESKQLWDVIDSLQLMLQAERREREAAIAAASALKELPTNFDQKDFMQFPATKKGETVNFLGEVNQGKAQGKGVAVWKNGSTYQGEWLNNMRHGQGMYMWADGEKYNGEYRNDLRHGFGVYITKYGERYEGAWADDKRHGEGRLYDKKGKLKLHGIWEADKLIKVLKEY